MLLRLLQQLLVVLGGEEVGLARDAELEDPTVAVGVFVYLLRVLAESPAGNLEEAPVNAPTRRLDEARAARKLKARW